MKRIGFIYGLLFCLILSVAAQEKVVKLKIVETSDVHGNYYPATSGRVVWRVFILSCRKSVNSIKRI